jgi:hypothetical protein
VSWWSVAGFAFSWKKKHTKGAKNQCYCCLKVIQICLNILYLNLRLKFWFPWSPCSVNSRPQNSKLTAVIVVVLLLIYLGISELCKSQTYFSSLHNWHHILQKREGLCLQYQLFLVPIVTKCTDSWIKLRKRRKYCKYENGKGENKNIQKNLIYNFVLSQRIHSWRKSHILKVQSLDLDCFVKKKLCNVDSVTACNRVKKSARPSIFQRQ